MVTKTEMVRRNVTLTAEQDAFIQAITRRPTADGKPVAYSQVLRTAIETLRRAEEGDQLFAALATHQNREYDAIGVQ